MEGCLLASLERLFERAARVLSMRWCSSMEFSWSFYLDQVAHQTLAAQAAQSLDKQPALDATRRAALLVYADNSNHIGADAGESVVKSGGAFVFGK